MNAFPKFERSETPGGYQVYGFLLGNPREEVPELVRLVAKYERIGINGYGALCATIGKHAHDIALTIPRRYDYDRIITPESLASNHPSEHPVETVAAEAFLDMIWLQSAKTGSLRFCQSGNQAQIYIATRQLREKSYLLNLAKANTIMNMLLENGVESMQVLPSPIVCISWKISDANLLILNDPGAIESIRATVAFAPPQEVTRTQVLEILNHPTE